MSTFIEDLDASLPGRTAGSTPSARTSDMTEEAIRSEDAEAKDMELVHLSAHYRSLELMLNGEADIVEKLIEGIAVGDLPEPTTTEEALQLAARAYSTLISDGAYYTAHKVGFLLGTFGVSLTEALQMLYSDLDHSDPERQLSDDQLAELSGQVIDTEE